MAREPSQHWYDSSGGPVFTQPKNGGGDRATTITDARRLGLLPSVTSILKILASDNLSDWKTTQGILTALVTERMPGETDRDLVGRIKDKSMEQVDAAAKLGTNIHKALEQYFGGEAHDPLYDVYVNAVGQWMELNRVHVMSREVRLASKQYGIAGTTDMVIDTPNGLAIGDFKASKTIPGKPKLPYEDQKTQIAVYAKLQFGEITDTIRGLNLYISPNEPGRVDDAWYDAGTLREEWKVFQYLFEIWCARKKYDPRTS